MAASLLAQAGAADVRHSSSERLRPAGRPAYGSAFAFAGCLPSCFATAQ
jgi:hypothetical protein